MQQPRRCGGRGIHAGTDAKDVAAGLRVVVVGLEQGLIGGNLDDRQVADLQTAQSERTRVQVAVEFDHHAYFGGVGRRRGIVLETDRVGQIATHGNKPGALGRVRPGQRRQARHILHARQVLRKVDRCQRCVFGQIDARDQIVGGQTGPRRPSDPRNVDPHGLETSAGGKLQVEVLERCQDGNRIGVLKHRRC